jgi:hypothetical protein
MEANVAVAVAAVTQHYEDKLRELQAEPEREALLREPDLWQVQIEGDAEVDAFTTKAEAEEWAASELDTLREGGVEEDGDTEYAGPSVKVYPVWIGSPLRALATPEVK